MPWIYAQIVSKGEYLFHYHLNQFSHDRLQENLCGLWNQKKVYPR